MEKELIKKSTLKDIGLQPIDKPLSELFIDGYALDKDVKETVERINKYISELKTKTTNETRIKLDILEKIEEEIGEFK